MPRKKAQPKKKEPHGVGLFLLFLIVLVLVSAIVLITQEGGRYELVDISIEEDIDPDEYKSGRLTSVYQAQHEKFFVPQGFPKTIFFNGYADIDEASLYKNDITHETLHTYRATLQGAYEYVWEHVAESLEDEGYKVEVGHKSLVAERSYEQLTLFFASASEGGQHVEIEYWKMDK